MERYNPLKFHKFDNNHIPKVKRVTLIENGYPSRHRSVQPDMRRFGSLKIQTICLSSVWVYGVRTGTLSLRKIICASQSNASSGWNKFPVW